MKRGKIVRPSKIEKRGKDFKNEEKKRKKELKKKKKKADNLVWGIL